MSPSGRSSCCYSPRRRDGKLVAVVVDHDEVDAVGLYPIAVVGDREAGTVTAYGKCVVVAGQRWPAVIACVVGELVSVARYLDGAGVFNIHVIVEAGDLEAGAVTGDVNRAVNGKN